MKLTCFECDRTFWVDMTARIDDSLHCPYCRKMVVRIPVKVNDKIKEGIWNPFLKRFI